MTDCGLMSYFLGIKIHQVADRIFISQKKYVKEILKKFKMDSCNPVSTPAVTGLKLSKEAGGRVVESI